VGVSRISAILTLRIEAPSMADENRWKSTGEEEEEEEELDETVILSSHSTKEMC